LTARSTESGDLILLVGTDVPTRRSIRLALEHEGFAVEAVAGGWQALMFALMRRPSLVILDMDVSGLNGEDVVAGLHVAYGASIPIVVVSDKRRVRSRARRIGALTVLAMPLSPEDVLNAVYQVLPEARRAPSCRGVLGGGIPAERFGGMRGDTRSTPGA